MKEFIFQNWKDLIFLFCLVLELLFFIISAFKKAKKEPSVISSVFACLPDFICQAERKFGSGNGSQKLAAVLGSVSSLVKRETGKDISNSELLVFTRYIEEILNTPQKKEK